MKLLAIDPGNKKSAWVLYDVETKKIIHKEIGPNENLVPQLSEGALSPKMDSVLIFDHIAIEYPQPRGQAMYTQLVDTIFWIGKFMQAWGYGWDKIDRKDVKMVLCGNTKAKDSNIRASLISRFSAASNLGGGKTPEIGTKSKPGPLYGFSKDMWAALAVAITWDEIHEEEFLT